jgi:Co/Zn/Cd efflux system component
VGLVVNAINMLILGGHHEKLKTQNSKFKSRAGIITTTAMIIVCGRHFCMCSRTRDVSTGDLRVVDRKISGGAVDGSMMGIVGAFLVARWSVIFDSRLGACLLDRQAPDDVLRKSEAILSMIRTQVSDLHVWAIGPNIFAADITVRWYTAIIGRISRPASGESWLGARDD